MCLYAGLIWGPSYTTDNIPNPLLVARTLVSCFLYYAPPPPPLRAWHTARESAKTNLVILVVALAPHHFASAASCAATPPPLSPPYTHTQLEDQPNEIFRYLWTVRQTTGECFLCQFLARHRAEPQPAYTTCLFNKEW
jgi:hypothetical protein